MTVHLPYLFQETCTAHPCAARSVRCHSVLAVITLTALALLAGACASRPSTTTPADLVDAPQQAAAPVAPTQLQPGTSPPSNIEPAGSADDAKTSGPPTGYRIGPDDLLEVRVFGVQELSKQVRVDARGYIVLPLIGRVRADGLTSDELAQTIAALLAKDYLQDPDVSIFILEFTTQRITLEGAVVKPGIYPIKGETTLLQAIASASGMEKRADRSSVHIFRKLPTGQNRMYTYNIDMIRSGRITDPQVLGNDIVVVQIAGSRELLTNSILRDFVDFINPFKVFAP